MDFVLTGKAKNDDIKFLRVMVGTRKLLIGLVIFIFLFCKERKSPSP